MPQSSSPRLLILDCDGVLIRSEKANLAYYNHLFQAFGLPPVAEGDQARRRILHTLSTPQVIDAFLPPQLRGPALAFAGEVSYSLFLPHLDVEPGWSEVLPRLRERIPVAVATNRGSSAHEVLRAVGLLPCLDLVVTIRDVQRPKPHPDVLLRALDHFGLRGQEALYVGDSELDRQAAKAARVPFLGFRMGEAGGARSPEEVEAHITKLAG